MTALPVRRRRRTVVAAVASVAAMVVAGALFVVGVVTLSNSREGEAVGVDDRPMVRFPATPNGALAITDADGELASIVVATLLPDGRGGSLVPVPVDATAASGGDGDRRPLREAFDPAAPESLRDELEAMLTLTLERFEVVDPSAVASTLPPFATLSVDEPLDAGGGTGDDTDTGAGPVQIPAPATPTLDRDEVVDAITTPLPDVDAMTRYRRDVALWTAIAGVAPVTGPSAVTVPVDGDGRPVPPTTMDELLERLWAGPVGVRGLASVTVDGAAPDGPEPAPLVIDRVDATLVFAQISPALVSTPNIGLNVRIVSTFTPEQLDATDGLYGTSAELLTSLIDDMSIFELNVVSIDDRADGAPDVTELVVTDPRLLADITEAAPLLFGESTVEPADVVVEGVDVEVTLGMTYLIREMVRADGGSDEAGSQTGNAAGPGDTVVDDE